MRFSTGIVLSALLLSGCMGGANTRLYGFPMVKDNEMPRLGRARGLIVVGPVSLNEEIDRPQLVIRRSASEVEIRERDQWAGTLEDEVRQLMIDSLRQSLDNQRVVPFPWTGSGSADYRASLEVREMTATPGGEAVLTVAWSIYNERSRKMVKLPADSYRSTVPSGVEPSEIVMIYRGLHMRAARDLAARLLGMMRR